MKTVILKDDRTVLVGRFETDDKERLFQMYESLSDETVRWALSPVRGRELREAGSAVCKT
ncbi:MAG: hypothetical protein WBV70_01860 [Candidatus Bathyarchaeia archaeon]